MAQADMYGTENVGMILALMGTYSIILLIILAISIIGMWATFQKAGVEGWKSIIPILNGIELAKIGGLEWYFGLLLFIPIIGQFIIFYILYKVALAFNKDIVGALLLIFFTTFYFLYLGFSKNVTYTKPVITN